MNTLMKLSLLGTLALGMGACSSDPVEEITSWKEKACACKDKDCAEKQGKAFIKLGEKFKDADKPSKADRKKLNKLANAGQECLEVHGVDVYDM